MRFTVDIDLDKDGMQTAQAIYTALRTVANIALSQGIVFTQKRVILDVDGNEVGEWEIADNGTNAVTQEDILADGSVVVVIVSPEDVVSVAADAYKRTLSVEDARDYLASHARRVSEAMLEGWPDALACARGLDGFVRTHGTAIEGEASQQPPLDRRSPVRRPTGDNAMAKDYDKMTKAQLIEAAKPLGIMYVRQQSREYILRALRNAEAGSPVIYPTVDGNPRKL